MGFGRRESLRRLIFSLSKATILRCLKRIARTGNSQTEIVDILDKAIFSSQKVKIWYQAETDGFVEVARNVTPIAWRVTKAGNALVVCYNGWQEVRTYRVDRILKVKELFIGAYEGEYSNMYSYTSE